MSDLSDYIRYSQPTEEGRAAYRAQLAAAEARGYDRAVANLHKLPEALFTRQQAIELLEAMRETTP